MPTHTETGTDQEKSERAPLVKPGGPVVGSARACVVCGAPLTGRPQQKCCSARCRAAKSRRARVPIPVAEAQEMRARLTTILETAWEIKAALERYGG